MDKAHTIEYILIILQHKNKLFLSLILNYYIFLHYLTTELIYPLIIIIIKLWFMYINVGFIALVGIMRPIMR